MGIFTPFYMKSFISKSGANYKKREKACRKVADIIDQSKLQVIARDAQDGHVRVTAIEALKDAELLVEIADNDSDAVVRYNAFKRLGKLGNEAALAKALIQSEKLTFGPLTDNQWYEQTLKCIRDPKLLAQITLMGKTENVRLYAVRRLEDQAALSEVARRGTDRMIRSDAVRKLTDSELLRELAADPKCNVRMSAIDNPHMTDVSLLTQIALEENDDTLRKYAVRSVNMTDAAVLARVALTDRNGDVRRAAVNNPHMTDSAALAHIALNDPDPRVRGDAVKSPYMTDQAALAEVAEKEEQARIRTSAAENPHLVDPAYLHKIALENECSAARKAAVDKITDQDVLRRVLLQDMNTQVREAAAAKVTDVAALEQAALNGRNRMEYGAAIQAIHDADALLRIIAARTDCYPHPNWQAALQLSRVAPERAVEPLVALLMNPEAKDPERTYPADLPNYYEEAIGFLMKRYREAADADTRNAVAALPNGHYGYHEEDNCEGHTDFSTHFDLSR